MHFKQLPPWKDIFSIEKRKEKKNDKVKYFIHKLGPSLGRKQDCPIALLLGNHTGGLSKAPGREGACHLGQIPPSARCGRSAAGLRHQAGPGQAATPSPCLHGSMTQTPHQAQHQGGI